MFVAEAELSARDRESVQAPPADKAPRIDLLAATAEGAPNVVSFFVNEAVNMGFKELDDMYVGMNLKLAQQLLYGRGEHKAVSIAIQLHRSEDIGKARARLHTLFHQHGLDLEVHDFTELTPQYLQIIGFMSAIFTFIAVIMGVIVLFTIVNTIRLAVVARADEIEIMRLVGASDAFIRWPFIFEGAFVGLLGAAITIGLLFLGQGPITSFLSDYFKVLPVEASATVGQNVALIVLGAGAGIGVLGSYLSVRSYLIR